MTENPFIPVTPTRRQALFLTYPAQEILYGGAAGGGKSAGLLMAGLQYVTEPGYAALLLRRTFADLTKPGALISLSHEWLHDKAKWNDNDHQWTFPSGATLSFGYLANENDKFQYQGAAYHYVGWDELTQFSETQYRYLFSRRRKREGDTIPTRFRAGANPGGVGHEWVRRRFIDEHHERRKFISAKLEDNPHLDQQDYEESLAELDHVTRAQLRNGDWDVRPEGNLFKREWFAGQIVDRSPELKEVVRYWDLAATEAAPGTDPDFTAGVKIGVDESGLFWVLDSIEFQGTPAEVEQLVNATADIDGREVEVYFEQEPGASGKSIMSHYQRNVLPGYSVHAVRSTGDKITRAKPFSAACQNKLVKLVRGSWVGRFIDRLAGFGLPGVHDDTTDAAAGAHRAIAGGAREWTRDDWAAVITHKPNKTLTPREILLNRVRGTARGNTWHS